MKTTLSQGFVDGEWFRPSEKVLRWVEKSQKESGQQFDWTEKKQRS